MANRRKANSGRWPLATAAALLSLLLFALFGGFKRFSGLERRESSSIPAPTDSEMQSRTKTETEAAAKTHRDTERRKEGDSETDNKERTKNDTGTSPHVPPQKGYGNGTPTLTSSRGAGGGGSDGPHPPPFVWEAPDEPYERALALHPGPGGPGRDELGSAVVDRLKEMLTDRGGDPIFEDSGDAVLYQAKGGYEIGPKPGADGATEPESGDYLILGPTGGRKYLLLFPKGTGTLRILRYGAEGEFKLAE